MDEPRPDGGGSIHIAIWIPYEQAEARIGSEPATFVTPRCPMIGNEWAKCAEATVWPAPPGQEAYSYVYKVKIRSITGIPYGEEPVTAYVLGDRAECMKQSEAHNRRKDGRVNEGNLRLSADPAERCAGPFYIRQD